MSRLCRGVISFMPPLMLPAAFAAFYFCRGAQFKKTERSAPPCAFAAFVELSPDEEAGATAAVKAAWQGDAGGIRRLRADLSVGELPEETPGPVLEMSLDALYIPKSEVPVELPPLPPSMRAADPRRIGPQPAAEEAAAPVFAKEELLKID